MDGYKEIGKGETAHGKYTVLELTGIRDVIDKRLSNSQENLILVPDYDVVEADILERIKSQRTLEAELENVKITYLPYFMKAVAYALREGEKRKEYFNTTFDHEHHQQEQRELEKKEIMSLLNPRFENLPAYIDANIEAQIYEQAAEKVLKIRDQRKKLKKRYKVHEQYNIGYAFDTAQGLMVFNIKDVEKKSLYALASEIKEQTTNYAKQGKIPDINYVQGGTFTISNVGPLGGRQAAAIPNYPETNILVTGTLDEFIARDSENLPEDLKVAAKKMLYLSFTFDHAFTDGGPARRFMNDLKHFLTSEELLSKQ